MIGMEREPEAYPMTAVEESLANRIDRPSNMYRYSLDDMSGAERQMLFFLGLRELKNEFWATSARKETAQALDEVLKAHPEIQITEAVCFGLGHLAKDKDLDDWDDEEMEGPGTNYDRLALGQLAAFVCWVDVLSEWSDYPFTPLLQRRSEFQSAIRAFASALHPHFWLWTDILLESKFKIDKVYLHDPDFRTEIEIRLLKKLEFIAGSNKSRRPPIKESTFLFSAHSPSEQLFPSFTNAQPALYIGNDIHKRPLCPHSSSQPHYPLRAVYDLQQPAVRSFFETRASFPIPEVKPPASKGFDMGITAGKPESRWPVSCMKTYWKADKNEKIDEQVVKFYEDNKEPIKADALEKLPKAGKPSSLGRVEYERGWDSDYDLAKLLTAEIMRERLKGNKKFLPKKEGNKPVKQKVGQTKKDGNIAHMLDPKLFEAGNAAPKNKKGSSSKK